VELSFDKSKHQTGLADSRFTKKHQFELADFALRRSIGPLRRAARSHLSLQQMARSHIVIARAKSQAACSLVHALACALHKRLNPLNLSPQQPIPSGMQSAERNFKRFWVSCWHTELFALQWIFNYFSAHFCKHIANNISSSPNTQRHRAEDVSMRYFIFKDKDIKFLKSELFTLLNIF
jgi:hypothetical protein